MRLQLNRGLAAIVLMCLGCARANPGAMRRGEISAHAGYYVDDDHTTVVNPSLRARVPVTERVTVNAGYGMDIISSASVDVVASASRMLERRHEASVGAAVALDSHNTVSATFRDSRESDYVSDGVALSFDRDTERRDRTYHVEIRGRHDLVGPGWILQQAGTLNAATATTSITQVVDRYTVARVALQADVGYGLQSSVYRYVRIGDAAFAESVPDLRVRAAGLAQIQRSLLPGLSIFGEYDFAGDNWGVFSHSVDAGMRWEIAPWLLVQARTRVSASSAASFYRSRYENLTMYRTRDRLLGGIVTWWPQLAVRVSLPGWPSPADWELGASVGYLSQLFDDFAPLSRRSALLLEMWITRRF